MKTNFLLFAIILLSSFSVIKGDRDSDELTCDHIDHFKEHFAGEGGECDSIGKVAVYGSCTSYKSCYVPTGSQSLTLTTETKECPVNEIFNVKTRRCEPGNKSENCPQLKCIGHGKNEDNPTTPIYSTPEPVTTRSSATGHINNAASTLTGIFSFSITFNLMAIFMSRIM